MSPRAAISVFAVVALARCLDFSSTPNPRETVTSGGGTSGSTSGGSSSGASSGSGSSSGSSGGSSAGAGPVAPTLDAWGFSAFAVSDNPRVPNTPPAQNPWPNDALHNQVIGADPSATLDFSFSVPVVALASHLTIVERTFANGSTPPSVPRTFTVTEDLNPSVYHVAITGGTPNNPYAIEWSLDSTLSDSQGTPISPAKPLSGTFRVSGVKSTTLLSVAAKDGYFYWVLPPPPSGTEALNTAGSTLHVGPNETDKFSAYDGRGYVSFAISAVQNEFTHLSSAMFTATQGTAVGDPYASNTLYVQVFPVNFGETLTTSAAVTVDTNCGGTSGPCPGVTLSANATTGIHTVNVFSLVVNQFHDQTRDQSQLSLSHAFAAAVDGHAATTYSVWDSGNDGISPPALAITYNWLGPAAFP